MRSGDVIVVILLIVTAVVWFYYRSRHWYNKPRPAYAIPQQDDIFVPSDEAVELLNARGYEIVAGKSRLPLTITLDGAPMDTRMFIDAFVMKDDELYIVKFARERKPLEMTASALRERLLVYSLLYPEANGVLYVDLSLNTIRHITFEIERS
ncbi:MAG: hypothetical protein K0Q59_2951 [Paenibacillus sp.]|jgi:hypothetical protein|nr:hypothetical protein [Paenibacillus sp.]